MLNAKTSLFTRPCKSKERSHIVFGQVSGQVSQVETLSRTKDFALIKSKGGVSDREKASKDFEITTAVTSACGGKNENHRSESLPGE